jgi:ATP-dependent Lhr-like helicase
MECIQQNGASFFNDLLENSGLLQSQVKESIAELVALGYVTSDSFGGLRALLIRSSGRRARRWRHRNTDLFRMEDAGRWSLARRNADANKGDAIEHVARTLLRRYGVVFWRLLEREAPWLPPWRELLRAYRRLESRGEIRGGRFVAGFSGEQFALPEAIAMLRQVKRQSDAEDWVVVSGSDPLNLAGVLTPGPKLASLAGNRLVYRAGVPIAALAAGEIRFFLELDPDSEWHARELLFGGTMQAPSLAPEVGAVGRRKLVHR